MKELFQYLDNLSYWQIIIGFAVLVNVLFLITICNNYIRNKKQSKN